MASILYSFDTSSLLNGRVPAGVDEHPDRTKPRDTLHTACYVRPDRKTASGRIQLVRPAHAPHLAGFYGALEAAGCSAYWLPGWVSARSAMTAA